MTLPRRLSALDASFLYNETANNPLHLGAVLIFEGHIPFEAIMRSLEGRIHLLPCYRQRLAEVPFNLAHPTLVDDSDFRLENHAKPFRIESGIDERQAVHLLMREYRLRLDRSRPLWEFLCFEGWPGGRTLVASKIHHALVDGLASQKLMRRLFDLDPDSLSPGPAPRPWAPAPLPGLAQRFDSAIREMMPRQVDALADFNLQMLSSSREVADRAERLIEGVARVAGPSGRRIVATPWNVLATGEAQNLVWFRTSTRDYRVIRNAFGGTTNDILLTVLSEGAARYMEEHGYSTTGWFRIANPVNVRRPEEESDFGNRVSMTFPTTPAAPMNPVERLHALRQETASVTTDEIRELDKLGLRWTGSLAADFYAGFPSGIFTSTWLNAVTPPIVTAQSSRLALLGMAATDAFWRINDGRLSPGNLLMRRPDVSFVVTYVPSVPAPVYLCGRRCLEQIGLLPVGGTLGYGVTILSYNHDRYIGMLAERSVMPDVDSMKAHVQAAFEELIHAAERNAANGRPVKPPFA